MHTINPKLHDQAYQFFRQEAVEFLQTIENGLMDLQADHSVPKIHTLMRAAHSIKGGAASVDLPVIQTIAHRLEDVFRALYRQEQEIDGDIEEILLQAFDCLRSPLIEQIQTGSHDGEAAIAKAEPIFAVIEEFFGGHMGDEAELPTAAELGFDIIQVVFSSDVPQGIERLQFVLAHPETEEVAGEIRAQVEVFKGIGELLNLTGFIAIAVNTLKALDQYSHDQTAKILALGQIAVENFQAAQASVLAGDRTQGGSPSEALLALNNPSAKAVPHSPVNDFSEFRELEQLLFNDSNSDSPNYASLDDLHEEVDKLSAPAFDFDQFSDFDATSDTFLDELPDDSEEASHISLDQFIDNVDNLDTDNLERISDPFFADYGEVDEISEPFAYDSGDSAHSDLSSLSDLDAMFGQVDLSSDQFLDFADGVDLEPLLADPPSDLSEPLTVQEISSLETANPPAPTSAPVISAPATTSSLQLPKKLELAQQKVEPQLDQAASAYITESVRVDLKRLERLNNLVGELVTQENSALLQNQQLQGKVAQVQKQFANFENLTKSLQNWIDQSQKIEVRSKSLGIVTQGSSSIYPSIASVDQTTLPLSLEFDPLEMDSYNHLYTMVQEALEEILQMGENMRDMALLTQQSQQIQRKKQQTLKQVRDDLLWSRMMPLGDILSRFPAWYAISLLNMASR